MKFAHIADTHIKNLKYHYEYKKVFEQLYEKLKEEKVDCIVHCGDIAHTKTQISPEFVDMCSDFFRNLANIAPTYIILGNHDGNLRNSNRQDAITPIIDALNHSNLHLLKNSGEVVLNNEFVLNVLSVFDLDNWVDPSDGDKINIALYHGSISNCETDTGWTMKFGEHDIEIFNKFDYAMLGDIHKAQILDKKGKIRYAGSTVQQNHGEANDKGFLIWEVKNKDSFTCKHIELKNPKPFITIELTPKGHMPKNIKVPIGTRLRLVSNNNIQLDRLRKAVDIAKVRFKPESVTFLNRVAGERGSVEDLTNDLIKEDLRNLVVQEELIQEYLKDYQVEEEALDKVLELNKKYKTLVEETEEVSRNINWTLKSLKWNNLFNFGERNSIDFSKLNGTVGIFGKNFSGKSSIIDSMLFTLFNSTSKNVRKNLNIINQTKERGEGQIEVAVGNKTFTITRTVEKYIKKLKGEETLEAKTDVEFNSYDAVVDETKSENGLSRTDTDKNIRKIFGTLDDFLLTSMASQLNSLTFINEGSTRRKEILAKFLDLEVFDKKYKMAKEDATDLRGALKRLEGREFDDEISEAKQNLNENEQLTQQQINTCTNLKKEIDLIDVELKQVQDAIESIPAEIIDIKNVYENTSGREKEFADLVANNIQFRENIADNNNLLDKINVFLENTFDIDKIKEKKENIEKYKIELNGILNEIEKQNTKLLIEEKKIQLLKEVPCGSEYSHCKFIKDAYVSLEGLTLTKTALKDLKDKEGSTSKEIQDLNPDQTESYLLKYEEVLGKKSTLISEITQFQLQIEKNNNQITKLESEIKDFQEKVDEYIENKEAIENKEEFVKQQKSYEQKLKKKNHVLQICEEKILELYKQHGSLEQKMQNLEDQKKELKDLREEYAAYDLYQRCMHANGIAYDIIKKKLPVINQEIAKVLANIVEFEIFFEDDGRKLDIFIKHARFEARPIELGSGAEKTIAAMAIRLALLNVSNLPKGNVFILDEPGTALDENNLEGFVRILDLVKSYFKTVILISHLDSLKDCVDTQIVIDKKDGLACVRE